LSEVPTVFYNDPTSTSVHNTAQSFRSNSPLAKYVYLL